MIGDMNRFKLYPPQMKCHEWRYDVAEVAASHGK